MSKTRAGAGKTGNIDLTTLKAADAGFGVFAVQHSNTYNTLSGANSRVANFMYNEWVKWNSTNNKWEYTTIKYWPNGNVDGSGNADNTTNAATSTSDNKVSFFAYAPYVSAGAADYGITAISLQTTNNNPTISYKLDGTPAHFVDLLWGTKGSTDETTYGTAQNGGIVTTYLDGENASQAATGTAPAFDPETKKTVNVDLTKQKTNGQVEFAFRHALAQVGGNGYVKVIADIDAGSTIDGDAEDLTKIFVSNITITNGNATMYNTGALDLATGYWTPGGSGLAFTETIATSSLNDDIEDPSPANWTAAVAKVGVKSSEATNVYAESQGNPITFIPGTIPSLTVSITYRVCTKDDKLGTKGCTDVQQTITKTITFGSAVTMNKRYGLTIRLGLTSVKFDATVEGWDDGSVETINLPINVAS